MVFSRGGDVLWSDPVRRHDDSLNRPRSGLAPPQSRGFSRTAAEAERLGFTALGVTGGEPFIRDEMPGIAAEAVAHLSRRKSSICTQVVERPCGNTALLNDRGQSAYYGKVGGCLITGNEDEREAEREEVHELEAA
jgi:hypothetical protein